MGSIARASNRELLTCGKCRGSFNVESVEEGPKTRLVCSDCGHTEDAWLSRASSPGAWTIIDPAGVVTTYASWSHLVTELRKSGVSAVHEPTTTRERDDEHEPASFSEQESPSRVSRLSAASLLDDIPRPLERPRLSMVESESQRNLAAVESAETLDSGEIDSIPPSTEAVARASDRPSGEEIEEQPLSMRDLTVVPVPKLPPSHSIPPPLPARASMAPKHEDPPIREEDVPPATKKWEAKLLSDTDPNLRHDSRKILSQRPPPSDPVLDKTPSPVTVLAAAKASDVDDAPANEAPKAMATPEAKARTTATPATDAKAAAKPAAAKRPVKPAARADEDDEGDAAPKSSAARPTTSRAKDEDEQKNGWLLPGLAVAAVIGGIWFIARGGGAPATSSSSDTTTSSTPSPVATTASPTNPPTDPAQAGTVTTPVVNTPAQATNDAPADKAAPAKDVAAKDVAAKAGEHAGAKGTTSNLAAKDGTTATSENASREPSGKAEAKKAGDGEGALSVPELLDKAGAARRAGDPAKAKELYDRVLAKSPGNVEAYTGLANVARAQGDLAGAKAAFQQALSANGSYYPALLGLADTEWDSGDKAAAKQHYQQLYRNAPSAPPRARERAEGTEGQ